jgi:hypothetical protein
MPLLAHLQSSFGSIAILQGGSLFRGQTTPEVLDHSDQMELVPSPRQSPQARALEPQGGLEMGKQHLDLLPLVA